MRRAFLSGLLAMSLFACATPQGQNTYSGTLDWSFETSAFRTDDGRGPWWLSAEGSAWDDVVAPIRHSGGGPWGRVHLTVQGEQSAPGHYGHMGAYARQLRVTRVLNARLISASSPPSGS
ncbi:MAG TPA: hypothetical protein VG943_16835 [Caulobacterales bacterium]|nr:hypothetical protein [Caulobacterales bacterium]